MKVKNLIEHLSGLPDDMEVVMERWTDSRCSKIWFDSEISVLKRIVKLEDNGETKECVVIS